MDQPAVTLKRVLPRRIVSMLLPLVLAACDSDPAGLVNRCDAVPLPLSGSDAAPVIVDVALEVQPGGIVVVATAIDPQGTDDLLGVQQSVGVFPDAGCNGAPIVLRDDLAGSGIEETFGTAVNATSNPSLYNAIANADAWPIEVDFRDRDDNRTSGRLLAPTRR